MHLRKRESKAVVFLPRQCHRAIFWLPVWSNGVLIPGTVLQAEPEFRLLVGADSEVRALPVGTQID